MDLFFVSLVCWTKTILLQEKQNVVSRNHVPNPQSHVNNNRLVKSKAMLKILSKSNLH